MVENSLGAMIMLSTMNYTLGKSKMAEDERSSRMAEDERSHF